MSDKDAIAEEVWVDEQIERTRERREAAEKRDETPDLRPSVEQDTQAKVDHADDEWVDGERLFGQTLEAEERLKARELEIKRTRRRIDDRQDSDREARTRQVVRKQARTRHKQTQLVDAREFLSQDELAAVNQQAKRLCERLGSSRRLSRATIGRRLAEHLLAGRELCEAVIQVAEEEQLAPGRIIPIEAVPEVKRGDVSIEGEIKTLFESQHPKISQVGLIGDATAKIKFTSWRRSEQPTVREGERVRFRGVAKNWYRGRCSVALTSTSRIVFPDRGRWWDA
ncbi:DNA-binding protein [Haloplanus rubicundus]|uniref:DNA-binding protein n=1 Tax=Haloplanus rubicundus TaxID=1547898 RepID=UPI001300A140|nr:DNA-binding protein [Haloplanus rubicundus]